MHVTEQRERERERERATEDGVCERCGRERNRRAGRRGRNQESAFEQLARSNAALLECSERRANMFVSFCQSSCPLFKSIWKSDVNAERRARDANDRILCSRVVHRLQVIQVHRAGMKMSQCVAGPRPPILATSPPNKASRCVNGVTF